MAASLFLLHIDKQILYVDVIKQTSKQLDVHRCANMYIGVFVVCYMHTN